MPGQSHADFMASQRVFIAKQETQQRQARNQKKDTRGKPSTIRGRPSTKDTRLKESPQRQCVTCGAVAKHKYCDSCYFTNNCRTCNAPCAKQLCDNCFQSESVPCDTCQTPTTHTSGYCGPCRHAFQQQKWKCMRCDNDKEEAFHKLCVPCYEETPFNCLVCKDYIAERNNVCYNCKCEAKVPHCVVCDEININFQDANACKTCICACGANKSSKDDSRCLACVKLYDGEVCIKCRIEIPTGKMLCGHCKSLKYFNCLTCKQPCSMPKSYCKECREKHNPKKKEKKDTNEKQEPDKETNEKK